MPDYKSMYFKLAAKVADAVELLIEAQRDGEESYTSDECAPLTLNPTHKREEKDKP